MIPSTNGIMLYKHSMILVNFETQLLGFALYELLCDNSEAVSNRNRAALTSECKVKETLFVFSTSFLGFCSLSISHVAKHVFQEERSEVLDVECIVV